MLRLKDIKMKPKLITLFLMVGVIPLALVGWWSAKTATKTILEKSYDQLVAMREIKKSQLNRFFDERKGDMGVVIDTVRSLQNAAFEKLKTAQELKKSELEKLFKTFSKDIKVLSKSEDIFRLYTALVAYHDEMKVTKVQDFPIKTKRYQEIYETFSEYLNNFVKVYGYYDAFLICAKHGHVMYTAAKEKDLGTNLRYGMYKDTSLARLWEKIIETKSIVFMDFEPYAPSNGQQTAFIGTPIFNDSGDILGVIALQIPTNPINDIVQKRNGMGKTGETYLLGQINNNIFYRSDRVVKKGKIGDNVNSDLFKIAFSSKYGDEIVTGSTGDLEILCFNRLDIKGIDWSMVSTISLEEAIVPTFTGEKMDYFAKYIDKYGYYDLFLIHPNGKVFYTVTHEADYGTNMVNGKFASSGLGKLVREVLKTGQYGIADISPYEPSNNDPAAFIAQPIAENNKTEMIVALQLSIKSINTIMQQRDGMGKTGETYLIGQDKLMRSDSFLDPTNHSVRASFAKPSTGSVNTEGATEALSGKIGEKIINDYNGNPVLSAFTSLNIEKITWGLLAEIDEAEVKAPIKQLSKIIIVFGLILTVIIVLLALFIALSISKPLSKSVEFSKAVALGDLSVDIDIKQKDEVGILVDALKEMADNLRKTVNVAERLSQGDLKAEVNVLSEKDTLGLALKAMITNLRKTVRMAEQLSRGNLTVKAVVMSDKDTLGFALKRMLSKLNSVVGKVYGASANVTSGSEELSATASQMSQGSTQQAAAAEEVSASMEEMSSNIKQNSENAMQTEKISSKSAQSASKGGDAVSKTVDAMKEIAEKISIIEEISRQTDLLALNAAIEAARAGEHGKGFAVVASEVRKLAERSQTAAAEISSLSSSSVKIAEEAGEMLKQIVPDIQKTAELVQEISAACNEQDTGAEQINQSIQQLDNVVQQNASASEEMASTSEQLAAQAESLHSVISFFKVKNLDNNIQYKSKKQAIQIEKFEQEDDMDLETDDVDIDEVDDSQNQEQGGYQLEMGSNIDDDSEFERY